MLDEATTSIAIASAAAVLQPSSAELRRQIDQEVQQQLREAQQAAAQAREQALRQMHRRAESDGDQGAAVFRVDPGGRVVPLEGLPAGVAAGQAFPPLPPPTPQIPHEAVTLALAFFIMLAVIAIGTPIARAVARRIDRGPTRPPAPSPEQGEQLRQIQTAVDAMAVEIERISENQRFVTRLLTEGSGPEGALLARQLGARSGEASVPAPRRTDAR
ncbi:MAG TPA: hypothetical protein VFS08_08780 [Gemmatimonadaceae bacterium]|nr:hypothetical protein [Gemmatimonadaceae bacterium]